MDKTGGMIRYHCPFTTVFSPSLSPSSSLLFPNLPSLPFHISFFSFYPVLQQSNEICIQITLYSNLRWICYCVTLARSCNLSLNFLNYKRIRSSNFQAVEGIKSDNRYEEMTSKLNVTLTLRVNEALQRTIQNWTVLDLNPCSTTYWLSDLGKSCNLYVLQFPYL